MEKKSLTEGDGLLYRRFLEDSLGITEANTDNYRQQFEEYAAALKQQLLDSVTISVNQPVCETFYQKNYTSGYYFRQEILEKFSDTERAQHFFEFNSEKVTLGEWIDYYRSCPVVRIIENREMLHEHLEQFVFEQLAWRHARKIGLLKDDKLLRFLEFYREKLMVEVYLREKVAAAIPITEAEMRVEYESHPEKYRTEPVVGVITIESLTQSGTVCGIKATPRTTDANPKRSCTLFYPFQYSLRT